MMISYYEVSITKVEIVQSEPGRSEEVRQTLYSQRRSSLNVDAMIQAINWATRAVSEREE